MVGMGVRGVALSECAVGKSVTRASSMPCFWPRCRSIRTRNGGARSSTLGVNGFGWRPSAPVGGPRAARAAARS